MRVAAGVEYCGADFLGWQRQPGSRTVQGLVEAALSKVADHAIEIQCAGRTDAGVHAVQQVIHFDTVSLREPHSWVMGTNSNLPPDVRITWVMPVEQEFHARFSAISRKYKYIILNRPVCTALYHGLLSWHYHHLDEMKMASAAQELIGEHDFTSYRASSCQAKSPVRNIKYLKISRLEDLIVIDIEANAFLQHMVRNIAGVLMMIGMGKENPGWAKQVLLAKDRTLGGITAPADGLYLMDISYDAEFNIPSAYRNPGIMSIFTLNQQIS